jgi:hypothetical protein
MPPEDNKIIIETLKLKYFELCREEKIGSNPEMTKSIDNLELAIRELIKKMRLRPLKRQNKVEG